MRKNNQQPMNVQPDPYAKIKSKRGIIIATAAFCVIILSMIIGSEINKRTDAFSNNTAFLICMILCALPILLSFVFWLTGKIIVKRYSKMNVEEINNFIWSHRDNAEKTAAKKARQLILIRTLSDIWAVLIGADAIAGAIFFGYFLYLNGKEAYICIAWLMYLTILLAGSFSNIRLTIPDIKEKGEVDLLIAEEDFPQLYSLAHKAADRAGYKGKIDIFWEANSQTCVGVVRRSHSANIIIDIVILNTFTEDEMYAVLLHEFYHLSSDNDLANSFYNYEYHIKNRASVWNNLTDVMYSLFDNLFSLHHNLYGYASSIKAESDADKASREMPRAAATSLAKTAYYPLFDDEQSNFFKERAPFYMPEEPCETFYSDVFSAFMKAIPERKEFWNTLIENEIISRKASHPTTIMRLNSFGFERVPDIVDFPSGEYAQNCLNIMRKADKCVLELNKEDYPEQRRVNYLEPVAKIEAWEKEGRPIVEEGYPDIIEELIAIGRVEDALAFADRVIDEMKDATPHNAYYIRGKIRLIRYDPAGIDDIYKAIEVNGNYVQEGLNLIGDFCCRTGRQKELDEYREKCVGIAQKYVDENEQLTSLSKKDNLSTEHLPDGMLEDILLYISSISEDAIDKIYLVRKTVSETFFGSIFIIKFLPETDYETRNKILHGIFRYLDSPSMEDWQFDLYDHDNVPQGIVEKIPDSCVFSKDN